MADEFDLGSSRGGTRSTAGSFVFDVLVALLLTGLVWFDFWGGTPPAVGDAASLAFAVAGGVLAAGGLVYLDSQPDLRGHVRNRYSFLVMMVLAVVAVFLVFPDGPSVSMEIGIVAFLWSVALLRAAASSTRG